MTERAGQPHSDDEYSSSEENPSQNPEFFAQIVSEISGGGRPPNRGFFGTRYRSQPTQPLDEKSDSDSDEAAETPKSRGGFRINAGRHAKTQETRGKPKQHDELFTPSQIRHGGARERAGHPIIETWPGGKPKTADKHDKATTSNFSHGGYRSGAGRQKKEKAIPTTQLCSTHQYLNASYQYDDDVERMEEDEVGEAGTMEGVEEVEDIKCGIIYKKLPLASEHLSIEGHRGAINNNMYTQFPFYDQKKWLDIAKNLKFLKDKKYLGTDTFKSATDNIFPNDTMLAFMKDFRLFSIYLIPLIAELALLLPNLILKPIPLLKGISPNFAIREEEIKLNRLQIASILANSFLCTFDESKRNSVSEAKCYNIMNFSFIHTHATPQNIQKMTCFLFYFHMFLQNDQWWEEEVIIIRRANNAPDWRQNDTPLEILECYLDRLEDGGEDLQVVFANEIIGGGVLTNGCKQEEIRFLICPELLITSLLCEKLHSSEAIFVTNVRRYSNYYRCGDMFNWLPETPKERTDEVVAIDAIHFQKTPEDYRWYQFLPQYVDRELKKALSGYTVPSYNADVNGIASGHWGCGESNGNKQLKSLIQWMAASEAGRKLKYYCEEDKQNEQFTEDLEFLAEKLREKNITIGQLYDAIIAYGQFFQNSHYPYVTGLFNFISSKLYPECRVEYQNTY